MFPGKESLTKTCTKFPDQHKVATKKYESTYRIQTTNMELNKPEALKRAQTKPYPTKHFAGTKIDKPQKIRKEIKKKSYENASLGAGYFFGEKEISKEIDDLLLKYQNYTYGNFATIAGAIGNRIRKQRGERNR